MTQEIFIKIYKAAPSYKPDARFSTWLFKVATNTCLNEVRKNRYHVSSQTLDENTHSIYEYNDTDKTHKQIEKEQQDKIVQQAILKLPGKQRAALLLRIDHEFSYSDIATQLDSSESSIKSLIFRARENLKCSLDHLIKEFE